MTNIEDGTCIGDKTWEDDSCLIKYASMTDDELFHWIDSQNLPAFPVEDVGSKMIELQRLTRLDVDRIGWGEIG